MSPILVTPTRRSLEARHPVVADRDLLAALLLDAYRNTIDDEGEDIDDAYTAIDQYFARMERPYSFVAFDQDIVVAFSFVVIVNKIHYIDPVVVTPPSKKRGLGRATVQLCLGSLAAAGITEVGATITDGNIASERLFAGLGFSRRGAWG